MQYPTTQNNTDTLKRFVCLLEDALIELDNVRHAFEELRAMLYEQIKANVRIPDEVHK